MAVSLSAASGFLSSPGIGSGLDIAGIVNGLTNADIAPLQSKHDRALQSTQTTLSAMGQLQSNLSSLQTSLANFINNKSLFSKSTTLSDSSHFTATATASAANGINNIEVVQLATQHSLASTKAYTTEKFSASDSLTIHIGTYTTNAGITTFADKSGVTPTTITIPPASSGYSLQDLKNAINASGSGVNASIVNDNTGARLVIKSNTSGVENAIKIEGTGSLSDFSYDASTAAPQPQTMTQTIAAKNSIVNIDGLPITNSSNVVSNAIDGLTLTLIKQDPGVTTSVTTANDTTQLKNSIQSFVQAYNATTTYLSSATAYDSTTRTAGSLNGDVLTRGLKSQLSSLISSFSNQNAGSIRALVDIGIKKDSAGLLQIDQTKLTSALTNNYKEVGALFGKSASATDSNVYVSDISSKIAAGTYAVNISSSNPLAGTFNGLSTTLDANGKTLKGTGVLAGLSVDILSSDTGNRGTVTVYDGLAVQFNSLLDKYLNSNDGSLKNRTDSLNKTVKDLGLEQDKIDAKKQSRYDAYLKKYTALDTALASLKAQQSALEQQLNQLSNLSTQISRR